MQFKVNFTGNITLIYDLVNEEIVNSWAEILGTRNVKHLCPTNHYIGYVSDVFLNKRIERLYELADYINLHTPERVIKCEINKDTYQTALNTMHVHFPTLKNDETYKHIWDVLSEYNDIIHWLESTVRSKWFNDKISESGLFRITLDFNKSQPEFRPIPESAYKLFDANTLFGELKIQYTHVGRHAQELFFAKDDLCPKDQFVPQRVFTASVRMHFTDDFYINKQAWQTFYDAKGRDFWEMNIDDPKLAFGYMKIGHLSEIIIDNQRVNIPVTTEDRHAFRQQLVNTNVINWEIIKGA